jgi:glycosyltransferase involved in cell wall biosynthesis
VSDADAHLPLDRPIRVGILAYGLDRPSTGIARYIVELTRALRANHHEIELVPLVPFETRIAGLDDAETVLLRLARLLPALMTIGPFEIAAAARRHSLDVVHDPAGISPFLPRFFGDFGRIVTIHDMVSFIHPETHDRLTNLLFHQYIPRTLRFVDSVVTVSDASKRDIGQIYRIHESRLIRIHCGVGTAFNPRERSEVDRVKRQYGLPERFILCVGALTARKNLGAAVKAFEIVAERNREVGLVIVGPKAWRSESIFQSLDRATVTDRIVLTGFVDDADLPAVYSGATCFVFPSIYEGFGLPVLEAMACGAPVVASNASSIPEVVGEAALLVDPTNVSAIADAIAQAIEDQDLRACLVKRGLSRSREFTWESAAAAHANLYWSVAKRHQDSNGKTRDE